MNMNENLQNKIDSILDGRNMEDFKVIEFGIDFEVVKEYWKLVNTLKEKISPDLLKERFEKIHTFSIEDQKELLSHLGRSGSIESYRSLERFMDKVEGEEMTKWAVIALQHCRVHLENDLLDEPIGFIATGLGGKGSKIRFYAVLFSKEPLRPAMISEIEASFRENAPDFNIDIEEVETLENCILVRMLCPLNMQLSEIVDVSIEDYPFIEEDYIATNMAKPTLKLIEEWKEKKNNS